MARSHGLDRDGGAEQLSDELLAAVITGVRPNGNSEVGDRGDPR